MNNLNTIGAYFEKLLGIASYEIKSGNHYDAMDSLNQIDSLIIKILDHSPKEKVITVFQKTKLPISKILTSEYQPINEPRFKYKTFTEVLVIGLSKVWKEAYKSDSNDLCYRTYLIFERILNYAKEDNQFYDQTVAIFNSFTDLLHYCIMNTSTKLSYQVSYIGYQWYESWAYININDYGNLDSIGQYFKLYYNKLWVHVQYYLDTKKISFVEPLLRSLFHGFRFSSIYPNTTLLTNIVFTTKNPQIRNVAKLVNELIDKRYSIKKPLELKETWFKYLNYIELLEAELIKESNHNEININFEQNRRDTWELFVGSFFHNNLMEFAFYLGSYALFIKNYQFIYEFWNYSQPFDSASLNSTNKILPDRMDNIIDTYVTFDDFHAISEYHLSDNHEIGYYYKQYCSLLILRQYTLPKIYTFQDFFSIDNIVRNIKVNNIDVYVSKVEELKNRIAYILDKEEDLKILGLYPDKLFKNKPKPNIVMEELITKLQIKKEQHEIKVGLDNQAVKNFKDSVIDIYSKQTFYKKMLSEVLNFKILERIDESSKDCTTFGINERTIKNFLAEGDEGMYFGFSERYGNEIAYQENNIIRHRLTNELKKEEYTIDEINELLKTEDFSGKMLICRNILFAHDFLISENDYEPKLDNKNPELIKAIEYYTGEYKDGIVYSNFDQMNTKQLIILDINNTGIIEYFSPIKNTKLDKFYSHIFFDVRAYSEDTELLEETIRAAPKWLVQEGNEHEQTNHLKKLIVIKIGISLKTTFNSGFKGSVYTIKK